jgi:hypothetical protein
MIRFVVGGCALALSMAAPALAADNEADPRELPMQFELRREGPAQSCGKHCRVWVSASGMILSETPRRFEEFARGRDLRGVTIALDSDGGSVNGALALGRAIRRLGMTTTVGAFADAASSKGKRSALQPQAFCGSMCTFVLLGGVKREVPLQAHVLVHQIWLGDRRDDPTSVTYSAEDLVLVQRDIGRIAQYVMEMVGSIDLLNATLKIPPWEPMYELTRTDLRTMRVVTNDVAPKGRSATAAKSPASRANGVRATNIARGWAMTENNGVAVLGRRHPLTLRGEDIGSFDVTLSCGNAADQYLMTYSERRGVSDIRRLPKSPRGVEMTLVGTSFTLKIVSSQAAASMAARDTSASALVPAGLIKSLAMPGSNALTIETTGQDDTLTAITIGNAGLASNFPKLAASCTQRFAHEPPSRIERASVDRPQQ